jgi:hypothetical protein
METPVVGPGTVIGVHQAALQLLAYTLAECACLVAAGYACWNLRLIRSLV